jgi:hypothetical protein
MQHRGSTNLAVDTLMASSKSVLEAATKWQQELLRFFSKRANGYVELTSQLSQCKTPSDFLNLQTNFVRQMLADYRSETEWIANQFLNAQKPVQQQIDHTFETYEETILKAQQDAAKIIDMAKDQASRILEDAEARTTSRKSAGSSERRGKKATGS